MVRLILQKMSAAGGHDASQDVVPKKFEGWWILARKGVVWSLSARLGCGLVVAAVAGC